MHERTVTEATNGLRDKGFISWVQGGLQGKRRKPNDYTLNFEKIYSCVKTPWEQTNVDNKIPAPIAEKVIQESFDEEIDYPF